MRKRAATPGQVPQHGLPAWSVMADPGLLLLAGEVRAEVSIQSEKHMKLTKLACVTTYSSASNASGRLPHQKPDFDVSTAYNMQLACCRHEEQHPHFSLCSLRDPNCSTRCPTIEQDHDVSVQTHSAPELSNTNTGIPFVG